MTTHNDQSWRQLLSIQAGGALSLPMLIVGKLLFEEHGWKGALGAIAIGNALLLIFGVILAILSSKKRLTTVEHAVRYMGDHGRRFFSIAMIIVVLGWFGVQLNVMTAAIHQALLAFGIPPFPDVITNISLGLLISFAMVRGMQSIKFVSNLIAPLLVLSVMISLSFLEMGLVEEVTGSSLWLGGMSLVIGAHIAAVIDMPTFLRHARSKKDALMCIFFLYGFLVPLVECVGIYFGCCGKGAEILETMQGNGGTYWALWLATFTFLAGWVTNNANLYSAVASFRSLVSKEKTALHTLLLGFIGTACACFNLLGNLATALQFIGILIGSMGGMIISGHLGEKVVSILPHPRKTMASIVIGLATGFSTFFTSKTFTGVPAVDAFCMTFILNILLNYKGQRSDQAINSR